MKALPDPVFILTESGRYAAIIGGTDRSLYHEGSCLVDFTLYDVLAPAKADWFLAQIRATLAENRLRIVEYALAGDDVSEINALDGPPGDIHYEGRIQPMASRVDGERAVVWVARNNSDRHRLEIQLRRLSEIDELTGICNRRQLMQQLRNWLADYEPDKFAVALLILDIDHFKPINDKYGHLAGDYVIQELVAVCAAQLAEHDLLARLGGEEFAVVLFDMSADAAMRIAERLRRAVDAHGFTLECGTRVPVTVSIGASTVEPYRRRLNDLLRDADDALYAAKRGGRNRAVMADNEP